MSTDPHSLAQGAAILGGAVWVAILFVKWVNFITRGEIIKVCPPPEPPRKVTTKEGYSGTLYQYTNEYGHYDGSATTLELEINYV